MRRGGLPAARRRLLEALLLGVAVSVAVTALSRAGALAGWETRALDAFVFLRDRQPALDIVLVAIDDAAFAALDFRQPLPRRYLADLARFLLDSGARVVAFDVLVETATTPAEDQALVDVARHAAERGVAPLVFAALATGTDTYQMAPAFSPDLRVDLGFPNAPVGADGVVRRMRPVLPGAGGPLPSFPVAVLAALAGLSRDDLGRALTRDTLALPARSGRGLSLEPVTAALLGEGDWRIDFAGPPGTITTFPSEALMTLARAGVTPAADNPFRGRIVIVGATFRDSRDLHMTPVGPMAGVEIQANAVHTLLGRRALRPPPWWTSLGLLLAACLGVAALSLWLRPGWLVLAALALVGGLTVLSYEAFTRGGYWLDFIAPVAGMLGYLQTARVVTRRRLRAAFGQFVSPAVMERVLREGADLGGDVRTVSVLMSDVRGFTTLSESLSPARISEIMNEYFTEMVDEILAHRGLVNDFIGDGILAIYGAPLDDPEHAWHAVRSAVSMQRALDRLNERWRREGNVTLAMGVAVNTGPAFAGNMGSPRQKKYSVLGDTVNTVARMEGLNRDLGTSILISAETLAAVEGRVAVRDHGAVAVKGKAQPVALYEVVKLEEEA